MTLPVIISETWNGNEVSIEAEHEGSIIKQTLVAKKPCCIFFDASVNNYVAVPFPQEYETLEVVGVRGYE